MKPNNDPIKHLKSVDPVLASVIERIELSEWERPENYFERLVESIISQQLSIKAADTIYERFLSLFSDRSFPEPIQIIEINTETVRKAGLSYGKIRYIKDLAQKVHGGILQLQNVETMNDEEVIEHLLQVKGIGRWTAEMFLMFSLGREDVFSYGDQGLKNAMKKLYKLKNHPSERQAIRISNKWQPYRTLACRYLWKSLEL